MSNDGEYGAVIDVRITSGYGRNTRKPFIQMDIGVDDTQLQMSPAQARGIALDLLYAADNAETDTFFVEFLRDKVGVPEGGIFEMLYEFSEYRDRNRGEHG